MQDVYLTLAESKRVDISLSIERNIFEKMCQLGNFYAQAIQASGLEFDVLLGPAYKGIPLATASAMALNDSFNKNVTRVKRTCIKKIGANASRF
jgi:orotate phosphoribosyltransferase